MINNRGSSSYIIFYLNSVGEIKITNITRNELNIPDTVTIRRFYK